MGRCMNPRPANQPPKRRKVNPGDKPTRPPTEYEQRVYRMCKAIPRGRISTYGHMAKALESSARAVGQAMRRNPYAPIVPCHRVVAADLTLGGFSGSWGFGCDSVQRKKALLQEEGLAFEGAKIASPGCVVAPDELQRLVAGQDASVPLGEAIEG